TPGARGPLAIGRSLKGDIDAVRIGDVADGAGPRAIQATIHEDCKLAVGCVALYGHMMPAPIQNIGGATNRPGYTLLIRDAKDHTARSVDRQAKLAPFSEAIAIQHDAAVDPILV